MKRSSKTFLKVAVPIVTLALFFAFMHYWARFSLERYKAELRAQGEKLTIAEQIPPPLPDADNGAQEFLDASASLISFDYKVHPTPMAMTSPGHARITWKQPYLPTRWLSNSWPALKAHLRSNDSAMAGMRTALLQTNWRFSINYQQGFAALRLPHLAKLRASSQTFAAAAALSMHEGNSVEALANLRALIALHSRLEGEATMISQMVRAAVISMAASATWETLHYPGWNDEQLAELQEGWSGLDMITGFESTVGMERACLLVEYSNGRRDFGRVIGLGGTTGSALDDLAELGQGLLEQPAEGWEAVLDRFPRRWAWQLWNSYWDELWLLKVNQIILSSARQLQHTTAFLPALRKHESETKALGSASRQFLIGREMNPALWARHIQTLVIAENTGRVVVTAIALQRFQMRHGKPPPSLSALMPDFLFTLPLDSIDGQPLRYRPGADGTFLLYSIGLDGKDDGGDPSPSSKSSKNFRWTSGNDWVWPRPANEQEVREYHQQVRTGKR